MLSGARTASPPRSEEAWFTIGSMEDTIAPLFWIRRQICMPQVHGFPKVMGVLTHLDGFKDNKRLKKTKKVLKHRFWAEIYQGTPL